jgi:urease subunit alpha
MMAEDVLHDLGALSIMASDSQAMGRVGEDDPATVAGGRQDEAAAGRCPATPSGNDNARIKRYVAKYTINPALAHGIAHEVGSIEPGKLADLVVWQPRFFGRQAGAGAEGRPASPGRRWATRTPRSRPRSRSAPAPCSRRWPRRRRA